MKTITKKVYYCEHCRKNGLSSYHMVRHEKHCTKYPRRECRVCVDDPCTEEARLMIKKYKDEKEQSFMRSFDFLDHMTKSGIWCPACRLTVLRCLGVSNFNFDYKKEIDAYWKEVNSE